MNTKKSNIHTTDIDPKIDPAFKAIVSEKKLLLGFLRDLFQYLKFPEPINLTYENDKPLHGHVESEESGYYSKLGKVDVYVKLKDHSKRRVELQVHAAVDMSRRLQFSVGKMFTNQFKLGQSYADDVICPTVVIGITPFNLKDITNHEIIHSFTCYDSLNNTHIPDSQTTIVTIELPKLEHYFAKAGKTSGLGYWFSFFRHSKEDQHLVKEYKLTMEAAQILEGKKRDDDFMHAYKQAKDILDDETSQLKF